MGKRGPRPTPTSKLAARGSWRAKDRAGEPEPKPGRPDCPDWVSGPARDHWPELVEMLANMGVMADAHSVALGLLVDALGRYSHLKQQVEREGYTTETDKGNIVQHPLVGAMNKAWEQSLKGLREFGMSPAALTAIKIDPPDGRDANGSDDDAKRAALRLVE